jgi:putative DNA-invertase from lambdoid prophage Rac
MVSSFEHLANLNSDFVQGEINMAVFGYGRVSTKEQTSENQRLEIEKVHKLDFWFADHGVSGSTVALQRPEFGGLLQKIRDGETLIVSKLDRLGRSAVDVGSTLRTLEQRNIKVIVLQLGLLDMTSPVGKAMLTMLSAIAELEKDLLIERTKAGLERARKEGKKLGRRPKLGFQHRSEVEREYKLGKTIAQIARDYKVSRATVMRAVNPLDAMQIEVLKTLAEEPL